jgi:hypothetical protein
MERDDGAEKAIDLRSYHKEEADGSHTVTLEISGLPSLDYANRVSKWMRALIRENASQIGRLDPNPPRSQ